LEGCSFIYHGEDPTGKIYGSWYVSIFFSYLSVVSRLLKMLDRWIKFFVWSGDIDTRKICTVSWTQVCLPWDAGGLDLKSTRSINESLILHLCWKLFTQNSQCSDLFQARFLSFGSPRSRYFNSSIWPGVKEQLPTVFDNTRWIVGNGCNIHLWLDNWLGGSLASTLHLPPSVYSSLTAKLDSIIVDGKWQMPRFILDFPLVAARIMQITLPRTPLLDQRVWIHSMDG